LGDINQQIFAQVKRFIEQTIIQPLFDFRKTVTPLNQIHNDCMAYVGSALDGLLTGSDGEPAFQGQGADALAQLVGTFLTTEQKLSGSSGDLEGRLLDASVIYEYGASTLQEALGSIRISSGGGGGALDAAAAGLGTGALVQGGADIPWDIVAGGVALIAGVVDLASHSVSGEINLAFTETEVIVNGTNRQIDIGPAQEPIPPTPPPPRDPSGLYKAFLLLLGIAVGVSGIYALVTQQQAQRAQELADLLKRQYGIDADPSEIARLLANGWSEEDIIALFRGLASRYGKDRTSLNTALAQFENLGYDEKRMVEIARIWLQVGKVDPETINKLLDEDFGGGEHLTESEIAQFLRDLGTVYPNDPAKLDNAVNKILGVKMDPQSTLDIAAGLKLWNQQNRDPRCTADMIVNGLNIKDLPQAGPFDPALLQQHFNDHGGDFGAKTPQQYQQEAEDFLSGDPPSGTFQVTRSNGDTIRFDPFTGYYGVVTAATPTRSPKVRTFYKMQRSSVNQLFADVLKQACAQVRPGGTEPLDP
jgi:hypothetical protein